MNTATGPMITCLFPKIFQCAVRLRETDLSDLHGTETISEPKKTHTEGEGSPCQAETPPVPAKEGEFACGPGKLVLQLNLPSWFHKPEP